MFVPHTSHTARPFSARNIKHLAEIYKNMTYWQIANGDITRDYSDVCLNFGIVCVGPGNPGIMSEDTEVEYKKLKEWKKIKPILEVKSGDRIVLKNGRSEIQAVGEVVKFRNKTYNYSNCFKDVDGWDLQHFLKVKWKEIQIRFNNNSELHRGTMTRLNKPNVIERIEQEWAQKDYIKDKYVIPEKIEVDQIKYNLIEEKLIDIGFRIIDAENTSKTIGRVEKLANWYLNNSIGSTEHEIRTFLVIPFLQALGWSPQKMGIEVSINRNKLDIILYSDNKRTDPNIVIETKRMWEGSVQAISQSIRYLDNNEQLSKVGTFIVTDGLRYWLYKKSDDDSWKPYAYMNFLNKQNAYNAYPNCKGMFGFIIEVVKL